MFQQNPVECFFIIFFVILNQAVAVLIEIAFQACLNLHGNPGRYFATQWFQMDWTILTRFLIL